MAEETGTEVATPLFGTDLVDLENSEEFIRSMEETADDGGRVGDISFMSFSGKRGRYKIGVDGREPGEEEPFLVSIAAFELGYVCWKEGKPVAKRMATFTKPKVSEPDLDEFGPFDSRKGEGWFRARAITLRSMENQEQCYFSITSKSGVAAMSDLQRDVLARMKAGQPSWPVVNLSVEEFESQGFTNFKPVFDVIMWLPTEDVQKLADPEFDPMSLLEAPQKDAPAPRKRKL